MIARVAVLGAGLLVAGVSVLTEQWLNLVAVGVVVLAIRLWKPSWVRIRPLSREPLPEDPSERVVRLHELQRWRRILVPVAAVAVLVNGWAYLRVITEGTHYTTSIVTTLVGFALCAWAGVTQVKIERLENA